MTAATIPALVEEQARRRPRRAALLAPGRAPLDYAGVLAWMSCTASLVTAAGVRRDDVVVVALPGGPELALAFLGVSAAAIVAPVNPALRAEELERYLADLPVAAVVTDSAGSTPASEVAAGRGLPLLELPSPAPCGAGDPDHPIDAKADDVALVLHTSGTTARPKVVPLTHRQLTTSAVNVARSLALSPDDICLNVMPLFHVHGLVGALLASLAAGSGVACPPGFSAVRFFPELEEMQATWYTAVPTMHHAVLARATHHASFLARRPLRLVRSCSAPLPPRTRDELETTFGAPVIEAYGMTEAAHQVTSNPLPPHPRPPRSVGLPTGPEVAILDGDLLAGPGQQGEVVLRGSTVLGTEAAGAAFEGSFWHGWYRTGDEGYLDDHGYLHLTGRIKEMINRAGEKIAPREIEDVLSDHPAVDSAMAFAVPDPRLGERVGAAVVLRDGATATEPELQAFVATRLADFKVPGPVCLVDAIPVGATGKPQRRTLARALGLDAPAPPIGRSPSVGPRTPLEATLAALWAEALEVGEVGIHDHFLDLGGDSLLATLLVGRIIDRLGVELTPRVLFDAPTIAEQATVLESVIGG